MIATFQSDLFLSLLLENKLRTLGAPLPAQTPSARSSRDSGYGQSISPNVISSMGVDEDIYEEEEEAGGEFGDALEEEIEDAGAPLLSGPKGDESPESEIERTFQGNKTPPVTDNEATFNLVPPTPSRPLELDPHDSSSSDVDQSEPIALVTRRVPSEGATVDLSRRISFNSSVRIAGGVRSSSRQHVHSTLSDDFFSPVASTSTLPPSLESPSQANERTPLVPRHPPNSRGTSPSSRSRRASNISLTPYHSTSTPTTSGFPSRSSSPCSSIYAPLTQPKQHCPSPMMVRPPAKKAKVGITFNEYLRGREQENQEDVVRGYRELVEDQRQKRERAESRRAKRAADVARRATVLGSAWSTFLGLMSLGIVGLGRSRGAAMEWAGSNVYGRRRGGEVDVEDAGAEDAEEIRTAKRKRSMLSVSAFDDSSEEDEDDIAEARLLDPSPSASMNSESRKSKSTEDVIFGVAPGRYIRFDWWAWKLRELMVYVGAMLRFWWERWVGAPPEDAQRSQYQTI